MAQNDMFVIMYKIVAYLYDCMKRGIEPDENMLSADALGIPERYRMDVLEELAAHRYVSGVSIRHLLGGDIVEFDRPRVTIEGVQFAQENTMMAKAARILRDAKASIPFI